MSWTAVKISCRKGNAFFTEGNFKDYDDVYQFYRQLNVLTIEIEHVNTEGLRRLEKEGGRSTLPFQLDIIKDKGCPKLFYQKKGIPTAPFRLFENEQAVRQAAEKGSSLSFVQKTRTAGYDGREESVIRSAENWQTCYLAPA